MPGIQLSMAISNYDHVGDLVNGRVRPEGIDLTTMELPIEEIFFRMLSFVEWDVSEFSMAKYVSLVGTATAPFRAIPVFPSLPSVLAPTYSISVVSVSLILIGCRPV